MKSKQEVFEDALTELRDVASLDVGIAAEYYDEDLINGFRARYAAAGKVPVPQEVGKYLDERKANGTNVFNAMNYAAVQVALAVENNKVEALAKWVYGNPSQFAEAWIHGWYAEEDTK